MPVLNRALALLLVAAAAVAGEAPAPDFAKDIKPILDQRCVDCHGAKKQKGKLRLDTVEAIQAGGKNGAIVVAGKPDKSKLYTLTILPKGDDDIMPAKGEPLTKEQTELLKRWIEAGAPMGAAGKDGKGAAMPAPAKDAPAKPDKPDAAAPGKDAQKSEHSQREPQGPTDLDRLAQGLAAPDAAALAALAGHGARIVAIGGGGTLLDVDCSHGAPFVDEDAAALRALGANVAWLDLGHTAVTAGQLALVEAMPNLVRLHLEGTQVSDASLRHLQKCPHLAYLNLVGSSVGDDGLSRLAGLKELAVVYAGDSKATAAGIAALEAANPSTAVEGAMTIDVAASDTAGTPKKRRGKKKP